MRKKSTNKPFSRSGSETSALSALPFRVSAGVVAIIVAAIFVYLPSLNGSFILDDNILLTKNELIKAPDGLYRFWCTTESQDYWPLSGTTLWIEWRLWGMNTTGYHVSNLILHIVESLLIWVILRYMSIPGAFLAAMMFSLHPVNVESVAWIAQRKNMMGMLFFLLSILCYLKNLCIRHTPCADPAHGVCGLLSGHWYWPSLAAFVLGMLSKGSVSVLPVLLLGMVWWLRPLTRWDLLRIAPFFVIAAVLSGVNVWFQTHGSGAAFRSAGFIERLLGAGGVVWFYLYKAIVPVDLSFVYPQWHIETGYLLWWLPLISALVVTAALWLYRKSWSRPFLFGWAFFCIALVPVLGFVDVGFMQYSLVADHYQHIAIIGVIGLATAAWSGWHEHDRALARWAAFAVAAVAMGSLACLTWRQSGLYRDKITLYGTTLEKNPGCWMAYNNLGNTLSDMGRLEEGIKYYDQALRLKSDYAEAHDNMGTALAKTGRPEAAIDHYNEALRLNPKNPKIYNNLAATFAQMGRYQEAIELYRQALRLKPDYFEACYNLGNALKSIGQYRQAAEQYEQTLRFNPEFPEAHNNLAVVLVQIDRPQEAVEHFMQSLRLNPDSANVYYNLALVYARMKRPSEAVAAGQKALELARAQGQTAQAKRIEDWLNSYRPGLSK